MSDDASTKAVLPMDEDLYQEFMIVPGLEGYVQVIQVLAKDSTIPATRLAKEFLKEYRTSVSHSERYARYKAYSSLLEYIHRET
jgi:hypothetical protein